MQEEKKKVKRRIIMTPMQKRAADAMIRQERTTGRINKKAALLEAGYSERMASSNALAVTNSPGFLQYMERFSMDDQSLMKMLSDDLQNKPGNRLGELTLAFKLKGYDKQTIDIKGGQIDESLDLIRALIKDSNE